MRILNCALKKSVLLIWLRKGDKALADKISAAIDAIRANGKYQELQDKYFDFNVYGD